LKLTLEITHNVSARRIIETHDLPEPSVELLALEPTKHHALRHEGACVYGHRIVHDHIIVLPLPRYPEFGDAQGVEGQRARLERG